MALHLVVAEVNWDEVLILARLCDCQSHVSVAGVKVASITISIYFTVLAT